MDMIQFTRDILAAGGPNAAEIGIAALQGDKDEVIRLLAAWPLSLSQTMPLLMPPQQSQSKALEAAQEEIVCLKSAKAALEICRDALQKDYDTERFKNYDLAAENNKLRAACEAEKVRILELNGEIMSLKHDISQIENDFRNTDNGWEQLGTGLAALVGVEWNCNNEELLEKVAQLKRSETSAWKARDAAIVERDAFHDRVIQLERGSHVAALKSRISDLEAIITAQNVVDMVRNG